VDCWKAFVTAAIIVRTFLRVRRLAKGTLEGIP
jgi:hypothetical protein